MQPSKDSALNGNRQVTHKSLAAIDPSFFDDETTVPQNTSKKEIVEDAEFPSQSTPFKRKVLKVKRTARISSDESDDGETEPKRTPTAVQALNADNGRQEIPALALIDDDGGGENEDDLDLSRWSRLKRAVIDQDEDKAESEEIIDDNDEVPIFEDVVDDDGQADESSFINDVDLDDRCVDSIQLISCGQCFFQDC